MAISVFAGPVCQSLRTGMIVLLFGLLLFIYSTSCPEMLACGYYLEYGSTDKHEY
jgi:hypothetical protein